MSLRAHMKALQHSVKVNGEELRIMHTRLYCFLSVRLLERFYLFRWEDENTVSTHAEHEIVKWTD